MNVFLTKWSDPNVTAKYHAARAVTKDHVKLLNEAVRENDTTRIAAEFDWFLNAKEPKVYFALRLGRSGKLGKINPLSCLKAATKVDLFSPCNEKAAVRLHPKSDGSPRLILDFGIRKRIAQNVLRLMLSAFHRPKDFQFTHRGVPSAIKRVIELINEGNVWFAHLDIKKFYPSFQIQKLGEEAALGGLLPFKTMATFVHARELEVSVRSVELKKFPHYSYSDILWEARRGIPTGSCLSSLVAPMMVSRLSLQAALANHLVNFEDDFFLCAKSKAELEKRIEAFRKAVRDLPGGQFNLQVKKSACFSESGLCFLGHFIDQNDSAPRIRVTSNNHNALLRRAEELETAFPLGGKLTDDFKQKYLKGCRKVLQYVHAWSATFELCEDAKEIVASVIHELQCTLETLGLTIEDAKGCVPETEFFAQAHFDPSGLCENA